MDNLTISIFRNQTFLTVVKEIKILSKFRFINFDDLDACLANAKKCSGIIVLFDGENKSNNFENNNLTGNRVVGFDVTSAESFFISSSNDLKVANTLLKELKK